MGDISKKLLGLFLGISLSLGVGAGLGSVHKEASEVRADAKTATLSISSSVTSDTTLKDGSGNSYAVASDGTYQSSKGYIQVGSNSAIVTYLKLTTSAFSTFTITKVQVWGTAKVNTNVSAKVTIGSTLLGTSSVYTTQNASSGGTEYSVENTDGVTGDLIIEISRPSSAKGAIYFNKLIVTYEDEEEVEATGLTITQNASSIHVGEEFTLTTELTGGSGLYEKTITWTSTNPDVVAAPADSEEGEVTLSALKVGTTTLTGTVVSPGSATASIEITVAAEREETGISLHGTIEKTEYHVGDAWDLTGLNIKVTWSIGDPTYVDFTDDNVGHECTPKTATDTSITSFEIYVLYESFEEAFTISGITVTEKPIVDVLTISSLGLSKKGSYTAFSGITLTSSATWAGKALDLNSQGILQLDTTKGYIYTTTSTGQSVESVSVSYNGTVADNKYVYFYGSNVAYTSSTDISSDKNSVKLATLDNTTTSATITSGSYRYIYIYTSASLTFNSITVTWKNDTYESDASAFGKTFLSQTSSPCENPSLDNSEGLKTVWSNLETEYGKLSASAKQFTKDASANVDGTDLENAMARYDHIIDRYLIKGSVTEINDFIGRSETPTNASNSIYRISDNNTAILVIVLAAFTSVTAIGGYFFVRKKRMN